MLYWIVVYSINGTYGRRGSYIITYVCNCLVIVTLLMCEAYQTAIATQVRIISTYQDNLCLIMNCYALLPS